ncbi:hypothetical protein VTJ04DRAFT_7022 [Mycothermus thermophilus]
MSEDALKPTPEAGQWF